MFRPPTTPSAKQRPTSVVGSTPSASAKATPRARPISTPAATPKRTPSVNGRATPSGRTTPSSSLSGRSTTSSSLSGRSTPSSSLSSRSTASSASAALLGGSTHKKYKAPLSAESRVRSGGSKLTVITGSPSKPSSPGPSSSPSRSGSRPVSRAASRSPLPSAFTAAEESAVSEMDVSKVAIESVLVDSATVEVGHAGDLSGELDPREIAADEDADSAPGKVMVSVRVRPTSGSGTSAWISDTKSNNIDLGAQYSRSTNGEKKSTEHFSYDRVHVSPRNKGVYIESCRPHVLSAMKGYNSVVFAYGQTASGKSHTMLGGNGDDGVIPRALRDVFAYIKHDPEHREWLLRLGYLEIYNECIVDLLAPPGSGNQVQLITASSPPVSGSKGGNGGGVGEVILTPLREEVITGLKGVQEVLKRGEANRRTACTDWNERSSRSHLVFRLVIESRPRGTSPLQDDDSDDELDYGLYSSYGRSGTPTGRATPATPSGRKTPGGSMFRPQTPGAPRLTTRKGGSVRVSVLSLIDLAGSEKATSDKERTKEGKYINTSLLTLGTVISTLAESAGRSTKTRSGGEVHVPYRNSKLTRLLAPSLAGNALISVICTVNPEPQAVAESTSTLLFARRVGGVKLNAQKKEVIDTDALIERYRKEIEDLKRRLEDREDGFEAKGNKRRLSAREKLDSSKAMRDLNARIQQLTKLILTSESEDVVGGAGADSSEDGGKSRPASPSKGKVDWDLEPYQLQQELLAARMQIENQESRIRELEGALDAVPASSSASTLVDGKGDLETRVEGEKYKLVLVGSKEDESGGGEWKKRYEDEKRRAEEKERWAGELVRELEREKKARGKLEEERRALASFVTKFDSLKLSTPGLSQIPLPPVPVPSASSRRRSSVGLGSASTAGAKKFSFGRLSSSFSSHSHSHEKIKEEAENESPFRVSSVSSSGYAVGGGKTEQSLLLEECSFEKGDLSFEEERVYESLGVAGGGGGVLRENVA